MKSKDNIKKALYALLDWLETARAEHIRVFWSCVFTELIMNHYPTIRSLHRDLMDGESPYSVGIALYFHVLFACHSFIQQKSINE